MVSGPTAHGRTPCGCNTPAHGTWMCGLCIDICVISTPWTSHVALNVMRTFSLKQVWLLSAQAIGENLK